MPGYLGVPGFIWAIWPYWISLKWLKQVKVEVVKPEGDEEVTVAFDSQAAFKQTPLIAQMEWVKKKIWQSEATGVFTMR